MSRRFFGIGRGVIDITRGWLLEIFPSAENNSEIDASQERIGIHMVSVTNNIFICGSHLMLILSTSIEYSVALPSRRSCDHISSRHSPTGQRSEPRLYDFTLPG